MVSKLATIAACVLASFAQGSHLDEDIEKFEFDVVKFKTKTDCQLDTYPNIRTFLEGDSAQFYKT